MQETSRAPPSQPPSTQSKPTVIFTLRLWQESLGNDQSEWRGEIKNLSTNEVRYFRLWEEIPALVPKMLCEESQPEII